MASKAYLKLLDKARCTVNVFVSSPFFKKPKLSREQKAQFLMKRLVEKGRASGYTIGYIKQLLWEEGY